MTEFKVPDEAVEAGEQALNLLREETPYQHLSDDLIVREIIEAALPVMFQRVGHYTRSNRIACDKSFSDILTILDPGVPVYRIKEPK